MFTISGSEKFPLSIEKFGALAGRARRAYVSGLFWRL
jgi:hypothetical protein